MTDTKVKRPRRIRTFKIVGGGARRNPASLRRFLYDVITLDFERDIVKAAEAFEKSLRSAPEVRAFRRGISAEATYRVIRDVQPVSFRQLDAMALHYHVPMALILLFTRVRSEIENSEHHSNASAKLVLRSFRAALKMIEEIVEAVPYGVDDVYSVLDHRRFMKVQGAYLHALDNVEEVQLDLI